MSLLVALAMSKSTHSLLFSFFSFSTVEPKRNTVVPFGNDFASSRNPSFENPLAEDLPANGGSANEESGYLDGSR